MKLSKRLADQRAYADRCSAGLSDQCEGFHRIEAAKQDFKDGSSLPERTGAELIAAERERQISAEGWTPAHDDAHTDKSLLKAAICYARFAGRGHLHNEIRHGATLGIEPTDWPWEPNWWKPSVDPVRNLVKAGALIAAEIDRLRRLGNA